MQSHTVVVSQSDPNLARQLEFQLRAHFHRVALADDLEDLRLKVARHAAQLVVADLDAIGLLRLRDLCAEFPSVPVVCTHRSPDTDIYLAAIDAGASECCHVSEIPVMLSALRYGKGTRRVAAAA